MLTLPFLVGVVLSVEQAGFGWYLPPLALTWVLGYFAFFAGSLWLKSGRKPRYRSPMLVYGALTALSGLACLVAKPAIVGWLLVFVPLLGVGLWFAARRDERSVASGAATVLAAGLMVLVVRHPDMREARLDAAAGVAAVCVGYFFGTVLYVKTLIRERGSRAWLTASVGHHGLVAAVAGVLAVAGRGSSWVVGFLTVVAVRAALVPLIWPMRGRRISPRNVGLVEAGLCVVLFVLLAVPALRG
jgi:hypothetical protein